ncbi:hypothetical protein ACFVUH_08185 [Kitasatospora sp. NPDC058032]|uniref:hypothetical protein n=1 Tax=Kitasatospora sp. NPDC058032 TaxID=3346307 RepID=UPI0036DA819D
MTDDTPAYTDHAALVPADYTAFEHLLAARRDGHPFIHPKWEMLLSTSSTSSPGTWEYAYALFHSPLRFAFTDSSPAAEDVVRVFFDEDGRALPDRPASPRPDSPLSKDLAEHLPGWSVEACHLAPGRALVELEEQTWGWGGSQWTSTAGPHDASDLTGPAGERLLAVRLLPDAPILVGAAVPDGVRPFDLGQARPPAPLSVGPTAAAATAITSVIAPRYRQAAWQARVGSMTFAIDSLRDLCSARITRPRRAGRRAGETFESEAVRGRAAWRHIETAIAAAPAVAAAIRAFTVAEDRLDPVVRKDLQQLTLTEGALTRLQEIRAGWQEEIAAFVDTPDGSWLRRQAEDLRNQEAWPHAQRLAEGPLTALAAYITPRIGAPVPDREQQMKAALARAGNLPASPSLTSPPAATAAPPPGRHRPTR